MKVKRLYIFKADDAAGAQARLARLKSFVETAALPDSVSIRAYTSQEDSTMIVETWMFDDDAAEAAAQPLIAEILADVRPADTPASHAAGLGVLGDRDRLYWND
ncbi:MAG: hypothetical protein ACON4P_01925 [Candidatus Puniceispirillales bacterium]